MSKKQTLVFATAMVLIAVMGMGVGYYSSIKSAPERNPGVQGLLWPNPKHLGAFTTVDENGSTFGLNRLKGKWSFLFFGYTHCPDVCPLTLAVFKQVLQQLSKDKNPHKVQMIFVTVDPARDTSERLKEYVNYFNKDIIGLGGTDAQIKSLTSQLGVVYLAGEKSASGDYYVDHSASVFLIDPMGRLVSIFSPPHGADAIVARYRQIRDFIDAQPVS